MPFIGNWQTAVFYPFSILFDILPFSLGLPVFQGLQIFIAGLFAYLFFRRSGLVRHNAGVGMAVFSFSGYMFMHLEFLSHLSATVWLFELLLLSGCWWALSLALGMCLLGGHPVSFLCTAILIVFVLGGGLTPIRNKVFGLALALSISLFIAVLQLIPVMEFAQNSSRVLKGIFSPDALANSLSLRAIATLISPYFQDHASHRVFGEAFAWSSTVTIGAIACILVAIGVFGGLIPASTESRRKSLAIIAIMFCATGIVLALGNATPIYPWLNNYVPGMNLLRYPTQYFIIASAGFAMLSAIGAEKLRSGGVVTALVIGELSLSFWLFQPTASGSYFHNKTSATAFLQVQTGDSRFILSPATQSEHFMNYDRDYDTSWQQGRSYLLCLTCMPYQLHNAYGFGEPLVFAPTEALIEKAYKAQNPQAAIPLYRDVGANYLLCRQRLPNEKGYSLLNEKTPFIYEIDGESKIESFEPVDNARLTIRRETFTSLSYEFTAIAPSFVTVRVCALPGWQLYVNGRQRPLEIMGNGFMRFPVFPGVTNAFLRYNPASFVIGLWFSIFTVLFLAGKAFLHIKRI